MDCSIDDPDKDLPRCLSKCTGGKCPSSTFSCSTALNVTCGKFQTLVYVFLFILLAHGIRFDSGGIKDACKCKIENKMK